MARSLLDTLEGVERRELLSVARRRRFARNEVLFHEGDPGDSLHLITKGYIAIRSTTPLGDVVTLAAMGPGDAFGELALLIEDAQRTASAVALGDAETLSWRRAQIDELRGRTSDVDRFLLEVLAAQVQRLSGRLVEALHHPAETRVLRRLSEMAELYDPDSATVVVPVTQEDLASMAGTTRPTANRVLKSAEADGLVALTRGRIEVTDRTGLTRRARA
jgi:CRP/FNR family transcriptional regulator, cyclic AMP receptor protein